MDLVNQVLEFTIPIMVGDIIQIIDFGIIYFLILVLTHMSTNNTSDGLTANILWPLGTCVTIEPRWLMSAFYFEANAYNCGIYDLVSSHNIWCI